MVLEALSDGIFIFENSRCAKILQRHAMSSNTRTAAGLSEINRCIARDLVGCCILPSYPWVPRSKNPSPGSSRQSNGPSGPQQVPSPAGRGVSERDAGVALRCTMRDVLMAAAPHPAFKLLTCRYLPQGSLAEQNGVRFAPYTCTSLLHRLERMFTRADTLDLLAPPSPSTPSSHRQAFYAATQQKSRDTPQHGTGRVGTHPNVAVGAQICMRGPVVRSIEGDPTSACKIALWPYALSSVQVRELPQVSLTN